MGEDWGVGYTRDKRGVWKTAQLMEKQVERLTGVKTTGCAWYALQQDPYVAEVLRIFNLASDYPQVFNEELPNCIYEGVICYKNALQRARNWWFDFDEEKRENELRLQQTKNKLSRSRR